MLWRNIFSVTVKFRNFYSVLLLLCRVILRNVCHFSATANLNHFSVVNLYFYSRVEWEKICEINFQYELLEQKLISRNFHFMFDKNSIWARGNKVGIKVLKLENHQNYVVLFFVISSQDSRGNLTEKFSKLPY